MHILLLLSTGALIATPVPTERTKATKESANAALQKWETCAAEEYELVTTIQAERALLPEGADTPEELKARMRTALSKKDECETLLAHANAEALRYAEEK